MIITVLWEDQLGVEAKGFGPHELLLACVADDLGSPRETLKGLLKSLPKKGNGNVRGALQKDIGHLVKSGPVFAVVDRDKIRDLWRRPGLPPPDCMTGIAERFRLDAPGDYDLGFLVNNVETLIDEACSALGVTVPTAKPKPDERDRILAKAAWATPEVRKAIRIACPSFDRVVKRVVARIPMTSTRFERILRP